MAKISLFVKRQIRLDRLNYGQKRMMALGTVSVASVINRVRAGKGPSDGPAKPLKRGYAIRKSRLTALGGKGKNIRDLTLTGAMLREFRVRSVSETKSFASMSTRLGRIKARANQAREEWMVFSKKNAADVTEAARRMLHEMVPRLALSRLLGGRQR